MNRMQWVEISTFSKVSYPDLVKAFYVCLRSEADWSLTSSVKGVQIKIDHELLKTLFGVSTSDHSGIHSVDTQAKGLGIVGSGFRLKDDSDMMFWAIQNQEVNMAAVIIERMKFAHDQILDTKSKLNVSLPYAHLLTKIFKHYGIHLSGAVVEKMGQAIRSRNLRKSGFSIVNGVWTKTSVAEGEAIIGEAEEVQQEVPAVAEPAAGAPAEVAAAVEKAPESSASLAVEVERVGAEEASVAPAGAVVEEIDRRIEGIPLEIIVPIGSISKEPLPSSLVASVLRDVLDSIQSTPVIPEGDDSSVEEAVASGHFEETMLEDAPSQGERAVSGPQISESVAVGHTVEEAMVEAPIQKEQTTVQEDVVLEDALIEGEHSVSEEIQEEIGVTSGHTDIPIEKEDPAQAAVAAVAHTDILLENADHGNFGEPVGRASKRKRIALKRLRKIEMKASTSKEISKIRNAMKWFNKEMGTMKTMLSEILKAVGPRPSGSEAAAEVSEQEPTQTRQQVEEVEPSGLIVVEPAGLSKPQAVQMEPAGPVISKDLPHQIHGFLSSPQSLSMTKQLHALIITSCLAGHNPLLTNLLRSYGNNDDLPSARMLFDETPRRSVRLWNAMIRAYARHNDLDTAFSLFVRMFRSDVKPDGYTFACVLRACSEKSDLGRGMFTHGRMVLSGLGFDPIASSSLISSYARLGLLDEASYAFNGVCEPDIIMWNSILSAYGSKGLWQEGLELFSRMRNSGINPDGYSLVGLISCLRDPTLLLIGRGVHGLCLKGGFDSTAHVRSILVSMYSRCGCMTSAYQVFDSLSQPDLVLWSAMITGFLLAEEFMQAMGLFSDMIDSRQKPDAVLVASILSACASLAAVKPGKEIHCYASRLGIDSDVAVSCALIDMYLKCGFSQLGFQLFEMMPQKNSTTYNAMIAGLGSLGLGREAIRLFEDMLCKGRKPDEATFSALLCACCHSELVKDARVLFRRMQDVFWIQAKTEHYVYMVKILGMAGELHEAHELIRTMPILPDAGVWGALLWCCNVHGDLKLAEVVAQQLFELEPQKTAYRVILSNMHAAEGNWGKVENLRGDITEYGIGKIPGLSWIGDGKM
ncbi:hypothetical protein Taro_051211 [Colocasia esculenta]|uniref:Pentatricopeptide repeat-containing protein n=1 Tax=Colocasia esculenta TaxID=4460 RepID=A0A843XG36_COLES|nr:hypothetical protein [Colocasia esculenta]